MIYIRKKRTIHTFLSLFHNISGSSYLTRCRGSKLALLHGVKSFPWRWGGLENPLLLCKSLSLGKDAPIHTVELYLYLYFFHNPRCLGVYRWHNVLTLGSIYRVHQGSSLKKGILNWLFNRINILVLMYLRTYDDTNTITIWKKQLMSCCLISCQHAIKDNIWMRENLFVMAWL